jgi:HD-GYP domain-containing protein (c-di-GMP phosphodiesterase class II)/DNA-binding CsgD family transcriptional regulator
MLGDRDVIKKHAAAQCDTSIKFAAMAGMGERITSALAFICARWDGKGTPAEAQGTAIPIAMRLHHVADVVEIAYHRAGRSSAIELAKKRSGGAMDPGLVATFLADADELLDLIADASVWDRFVAAEPRPHLEITAAQLDDVTRAFAYMADLKSTFTLGHSLAVADLAARAAAACGLATAEVADVRRAGWLHDLGRVSVSNGVWDKPGKLTAAEWERVRLHAYWTERSLYQARPLRPIAQLAAGSHERADGSGYHRALPGAVLAKASRILGAADAYHAMREPRPHRPALSADAAARELRAEVEAGRLDRETCGAVLDAAGVASSRLPSWPAQLTDREVEVLRLVARGQSNKQIGAKLGISPKTVQHHVAHVYAKIGVGSRAGAAIFATEHGLLDLP